jgi:hypothetical protein
MNLKQSWQFFKRQPIYGFICCVLREQKSNFFYFDCVLFCFCVCFAHQQKYEPYNHAWYIMYLFYSYQHDGNHYHQTKRKSIMI